MTKRLVGLSAFSSATQTGTVRNLVETWAVMVTWFSPFSMAARSLSPSGVFTVTTGILESRSTVEGTGWPQMGLMDML